MSNTKDKKELVAILVGRGHDEKWLKTLSKKLLASYLRQSDLLREGQL